MAASTRSQEARKQAPQRPLLHYLARRGELPTRRVGSRWLFLRDRLAAALAPLDEPGAWRPQNHNLRRDNSDPQLRKP